MSARLTRPICAITAVVALAALLVVVLASGGAERSAAKANKPPVVGEVTSVGGTGKITVAPQDGQEHALESGDELRLGDTIDPDQGVTASLALKVPKGVSGNKELVYVAPGKNQEHSVILERTGKDQTSVTISDVPAG